MYQGQLLRILISEIILEARKTQTKRLQAFTNSITSDIMRLVHQKSTKLPASAIGREDYLTFDPKTQTEEFYEIIAGGIPISMDWESHQESDLEDSTVYATIEIDRSAKSFNVSGEDKDPSGEGRLGFTVTIEIPTDFSTEDYNQIRDQVANSVRHEIEHITQGPASDQDFLAFGRGDEYYKFSHTPESVESSYAKYLLKPEEIPAFVRGETHNAKNLSQLILNIEVFLDGYVSQNLITPEEKLVVLDTWIDWAKRHIHSKGF